MTRWEREDMGTRLVLALACSLLPFMALAAIVAVVMAL